MNLLKHYKKGIIAVLVTAIVLVIAFMTGGEKISVTEQEPASSPCVTVVVTKTPEVSPTPEMVKETAVPTPKAEKQEQTDTTQTEEPQEPKKEENDNRLTCTLSVKCHTILNNMSKLRPEKTGLIPSDGVVFSETEVEFYEGESVINVLTREMKKNKIHLEFVNVPLYNSAYIEGIANIYERDCGELSGWMYRVNGSFPGYGASQYKLKKGDRIEWLYTCDLGTDIGGGYAPRNGRKNDD